MVMTQTRMEWFKNATYAARNVVPQQKSILKKVAAIAHRILLAGVLSNTSFQ